MSKTRVNYKSDLPPVQVKFRVNGETVNIPDHDFAIRFFIDGVPGVSFVCAYDKSTDTYKNCAKTAADTLTCYINNHKFGCGRLCCEFVNLKNDSRYSDGIWKTVTPSILDVILVDGPGDDNDIEVLQALFDYEINEIKSIETVTSTADGGNNVVTIKQTVANDVSFNVKNGTRGSSGEADEEDLTWVPSGNNAVLKFADKSYSAANFSGLGRKYLRKNIQTVSNVEKNILTSAMVSDANTVYHIQYDYDLDGESITLPANSVLSFEGGSLINGTIVCQNTSITSDKLYQFFKQVKVTGTLLNSRINVIWFGIMPNDNTIDAATILKNYIEGYKGEIYFPAGKYYFSQYHYTNTSNDVLQIIGDADVGLGSKTWFYPYTNNQSYIIKIGGSSDTINGKNVAWNVRIMDISFATPEGYAPTDLSIGYTDVSVPYPHAALILDGVGKGRFGINGGVCNTPLVVIGFVGEATFDYITCYQCQGKSDMPVISIISSATKSVTATIIKRLECETIAGPVLWSCSGSSTSELYINNMLYEGTVCFTAPNGCLSDQQKYNSLIDYTQYTQVPVFDLKGYASPKVDRLSLTQVDITWLNSKDEGNTRCVRTLYNGNNVGGTLAIRELCNNYDSYYLATKSKSVSGGRGGISVDKIVKAAIVTLNTNAVQGGIINVADGAFYTARRALDAKAYKGQELYEIQDVIYDSDSNLRTFTTRYATSDVTAICCMVGNGTYLFDKNGIILPNDVDSIILNALKTGSANILFDIAYFDANDAQIDTRRITTTFTANVWGKVVLPIDRSVDFAYIKINYPSSNAHYTYIKEVDFVKPQFKYIATPSSTSGLSIGDDVYIQSTDKFANYGYVIDGVITGKSSVSSTVVKIYESPSKTFVLQLLSAINNPLYVRFLKENDWDSADYKEIVLPAYTSIKQFEPDINTYPYFGFKSNSSFRYYIYTVSAKVGTNGISAAVLDIGEYNTISSLSMRPKVGEVPLGFCFFDISQNRPIYARDVVDNKIVWVDSDGYPADAKRSGTTANRPTLTANDKGFTYWDTSLGKMIAWDGSAWKNLDGSALS